MTEYKFNEVKTERYEEREVTVPELLELFKNEPGYQFTEEEALRYVSDILAEHPCLWARFNFIIGKTLLRAVVKSSDVLQRALLLDSHKPTH